MSGIGSVGGGIRPPLERPSSFDKLDGNGDGGLSLDEFADGAPKSADSSKTEALFKTIDSDGSGSVSKEESEAFKTEQQKAQQRLQSFLFDLRGQTDQAGIPASTQDESDVFGTIEAGADGGGDTGEFLKAISNPDTKSSDLLSKLAVDSDADGSVSKEERKSVQHDTKDSGAPPSGASFNASQAYDATSRLGGRSWLASASTRYPRAD